MTFQPHWEAVPEPTRKGLNRLVNIPELSDFYLAGGTALALQIGHRVSYDLDFFSWTNPLGAPERELLARTLSALSGVTVRTAADTMIYASIEDVEVSFIHQHHRLVSPLEKLDALSLAGPIDIGLMKLSAIKDRGRRRDFVDLYCLRHLAPLEVLFDLLAEKYYDRPDFSLHLAYGLRYFEDAESDPRALAMLEPVRWSQVKEYCQAGARVLTQRLTKLSPKGL
ncbi:MAG: nucleotidyl transferase AbiEii/AbiGii toxin family protein [Chloroflexi bacterium]|nr:nucleotidyl transferase AbiEii/AbiGii toxin family protein [Chloroflexota bacterium]